MAEMFRAYEAGISPEQFRGCLLEDIKTMVSIRCLRDKAHEEISKEQDRQMRIDMALQRLKGVR